MAGRLILWNKMRSVRRETGWPTFEASWLCEQIAGVEDDLALTLREVARTATKTRGERLNKLASAAQDYAATERARAREYSE